MGSCRLSSLGALLRLISPPSGMDLGKMASKETRNSLVGSPFSVVKSASASSRKHLVVTTRNPLTSLPSFPTINYVPLLRNGSSQRRCQLPPGYFSAGNKYFCCLFRHSFLCCHVPWRSQRISSRWRTCKRSSAPNGVARLKHPPGRKPSCLPTG